MPATTALLPRLFAKVGPPDERGCWRWTGVHASAGYGQIWFAGRMHMAHRMVYEVLVGPIPEGLQLDHLCRVRDCVNPRHLEPVTVRTNLVRGETNAARNIAKDRCVRGHEFLPFDGRKRRCRTCERDRMRAYRAARRAAA